MKLFIISILLFCSFSVFSQNIDSCGYDNNPKLTIQESNFLNEYFKETRGSFDFSNKKIIFVTGPSGNDISTKSDFFNEIKKMIEPNKLVASILILSDKEKLETGGYDAILIYWVKVFTASQRENILNQIKQ